MANMDEIRQRSVLAAENAQGFNTTKTLAFVRHARHPSGYVVDLVAPNAVRPKHGKVYALAPMPKYGAHTEAALLRLGVSQAEIAEMIAEGAAATAWSRNYLPD
jgi:crotonobetainyl-CoA:carnitine CoA-transferase CaiB-like acyl-CoA transferase